MLIIFFALELFFRFIIPACQTPFRNFHQKDQIIKLKGLISNTGTYTIGNLAQQKGKYRINNAGWNSCIDYHKSNRNKPLIALIGDSFIEAVNVDVDKSYAAFLRAGVNHQYNVYRFAISGAPFSQYLHICRHVNKHYNPDFFIINLVHNDFYESLQPNTRKPGMLYLHADSTGVHEQKILPFHPNRIKRFLSISSIIRYLYINLKINRKLSLKRENAQFNANINVKVAKSFENEIAMAVDYILERISIEFPGKKVFFTMDAPRKDLYAGNLENSNVAWLNQLMMAKTEKYGFPFLDMTETFQDKFQKTGKKYETVYDAHWNEYGHQVVAERIVKELKERKLLN